MKDFQKRFGIEIDDKKAQYNFIARAEVSIFDWAVNEGLWKPDFIRWLSLEMGEKWHEHIVKRPYSYGPDNEYVDIEPSDIIKNQFNQCLKLIQCIYKYAKEKFKPQVRDFIEVQILTILDKSEKDLGVFWKDGEFYPAGAELLDEKLIKDELDWLNNYPAEKKDFDEALKAFIQKKYNDAVADCYKCIEGIVKNILGNNKTLENNKDGLLAKLNLSKEWKLLLGSYLTYANVYGKHASEKRHKVDPNEVEAFIYLTGLIIRIISSKITKGEGVTDLLEGRS